METKYTTTEKPIAIILGIILIYLLITSFTWYFFFLHRISLNAMITICILFTIIYIPRFSIILKIHSKDKIKVNDNNLIINNKVIYFNSILDFQIKPNNKKVIFFINNQMVIYQDALFILRTNNGIVQFNVIGSEKIQLLKEYLSNIIRNNQIN